MSASSSVQTAAGGVVVVTHVIPVPQNSPWKNELSRLHLVALGTVQLLIGLVVFLLGFMEFSCPGLGVHTSAFAWGPTTFIVTGSVTVAASKSSNRSVVSAARGLSVAAVFASSISTIIYICNAVGFYELNRGSSDPTHNCFVVDMLSGIVALFSFVEFIVSGVVIGFSCEASDPSTDQQLINTTDQSRDTAAQTSESVPTYETLSNETAPAPSANQYEMMKDPEYNTTINTSTPPPKNIRE